MCLSERVREREKKKERAGGQEEPSIGECVHAPRTEEVVQDEKKVQQQQKTTREQARLEHESLIGGGGGIIIGGKSGDVGSRRGL